VDYRGKCAPIPALEKLIANGTVKKHERLSPELLKRIRDGAGHSNDMDLGNWQILVEQGVVSG